MEVLRFFLIVKWVSIVTFTVTLCMAFMPNLLWAESASLVLIEKRDRRLILKRGDRVVAQYSIALGGNPVGPKRCQSDQKTPEGRYVISEKNSKSSYYKSLRISYPNEKDRRASRSLKCLPGGDIMIHGLPNGQGWIGAAHRATDWTLGCVAVTNSEIDEIWKRVPVGTAVEIRP